jgi:opacity protein-like surface antigen
MFQGWGLLLTVGGFMFRKVVVVLAVVLLSATAAFAAPYVSGNIGIVSVMDSDLTEPGLTGSMSFDPGLGVMGAVGSDFMPGVRGEVELAYRTNDMDTLTIDGFGSGPIDGEITCLSMMVNVFKDFHSGSSLVPFIGGGLGIANVEAEINGLTTKEDDTVIAYQLAAGAGYAVSNTLTLDAQYRFFGTSNPDFAGTEAEYMSHNFLVGARINF